MDATQRMILENLEVARRAILRKLRDPDAWPENAIIIPMNLLAGGRVPLTQSRWQVLLQVRAHGEYRRLQDLADDLGRGKHRVSKDVDVLAALGLVHKQRSGRQVTLHADSRPIVVA